MISTLLRFVGFSILVGVGLSLAGSASIAKKVSGIDSK